MCKKTEINPKSPMGYFITGVLFSNSVSCGLWSTAAMSLYTLPASRRHGEGDNGNQRDYASAKRQKKVQRLQLALVKNGTKLGYDTLK